MSLSFKTINIKDHHAKLKEFIKQTNLWIVSNKKQILEETKSFRAFPKSAFLFEGVLLPFSNYEEEFQSNLIVRIIEDDFKIFLTRKRVPYKILIETIEFI